MTLHLMKRYPILVSVLPRFDGVELNPLGLTLVDKKKHWEGVVRRGRVDQVHPSVSLVAPGDVIIFKATDGFTLDGEAIDPENPLKGENVRFLKEHECMALEVSA